ncbi:MAG: hypothetical protein AVDCRST_MAG19-2666, partial [uncultured Thermomicrobiales bacterium]
GRGRGLLAERRRTAGTARRPAGGPRRAEGTDGFSAIL